MSAQAIRASSSIRSFAARVRREHPTRVSRAHARAHSVVVRAYREEELLEKLMAMIGGGAGGAAEPGIIDASKALPGRSESMRVPEKHNVLGTPMKGPWPEGMETIVFATGCFWGTEKMFWRIPGVYSTAVGYIAGHTPNPTYEEVCSQRTGHTECVQVVYDPKVVSLADLLSMHWTCHDPTQGMRQGNDRGTQYRSGIYCNTDEQLAIVNSSKEVYQKALTAQGRGEITSEICGPGKTFYYAEAYHQNYLSLQGSRPYCSAQPTGVPVPADWLAANGAKFGPGFWVQYGPRPGCTINVPNTPISIEEATLAR